MEKTFFIIVNFTFLVFQLSGQDTLQINEVVKTASFQNVFQNSDEELIDSTLQSQYKNSSIDEVLAIQTSSQIKTYGGLGNLATISLRGSGGNHVAINWNGFKINSVTTGGTDLSLIQTGFFEDVKLIPGASSSLFGSGTFGGALELNNSAKLNQGFNINIGSEIGSFKTHKYFAQSSVSTKNIYYKLSVNKIYAKNNFTFTDNYKFENPIETRKHNALKSFSVIQNFMLKLPKNNSLESGIWFVKKEKEIPEIAGSYIEGNKLQYDSIFRTFLRWKKLGAKYLFTVSSAFFSEFIHYTDKTNYYDTNYYINSKIKAKIYNANVSYRYYFNKKLTLDFAGVINNQNVFTSNYNSKGISETNYSLISLLKYKISNYDFKINFRNEFLDNKKYIPLIDLGASKTLFQNKFIIKANFSNKFRRPSFNEKYWQPGGNLKINEETGTNSEISFKYNYGNVKNPSLNVTFYHSVINNMIQWVPNDGVWSAQNNKKVEINGIETNIKHSLQTGGIENTIYASYNFTNAVLKEVYSNEDFIPQLLVYTPQNSAKFYITSSYKKLTLSWATQLTSKRYITQENNEDYILPAYFLSNIYAIYNIDYKKFSVILKTKILNVFNKQYEIIKSYPSSKRAFYINVIFEFKNIKK